MPREAHSKKLEYIKNLYAREFDDLNQIEFSTARPGMQLGADEGKLLFLLIKMKQVKTILEIGTFLGYSATWMAKALPDDGALCTLEKNAEYARQARQNFIKCGVSDKIEIVEGDAMEILPTLQSKEFDMIFIDANKAKYLEYLEFAEKMLKKDGLLVTDNTLLFDAVFDNEIFLKSVTEQTIINMRKFNEKLANKDKFCAILLPTENGLTVALKTY